MVLNPESMAHGINLEAREERYSNARQRWNNYFIDKGENHRTLFEQICCSLITFNLNYKNYIIWI